jgi:para-nitrobenzyl esterase
MRSLRNLAFALPLFLVAAWPCAIAQVRDRAIPRDPIAVTGGRIAGNLGANGVRSYMGVPFAAPPVGDLRWKPPQPVAAWQGIREALTLPPACYQDSSNEAISEDCLYLNLWAPTRGKRLPVVVYVYGGGFAHGSASSALSAGANLAAKGVIVVEGNYRVGNFGFMAHPDLDKESPHNASGDYGLLDQLEVLKWAQANITRFGGDPANVTLVGHSAGSVSASALQASPLARGLFQKVMGISASSLTWEAGVFRSREKAESDGLAVQAALGGKSIAEMRRLTPDKILAQRGGPPSIDGWFMPRDPKDIFAAGEQNDAAAFVGFTRDEGYGALTEVKSAQEYEAAAQRMYGPDGAKLLALYPADANWKHNAQLAARDITLGTAMRRWAMGQAAPGRKPAYVYLSATIHHYPPDLTPQPGTHNAVAYHGSDMPFWLDDIDGFNAVKTTRVWSSWDRTLTAKMSDMLVAFAKTGNPSIPGVAVPRYDPANEQVIAIGVDGQAIAPMPFPARENVAFLHGLKILPRDSR